MRFRVPAVGMTTVRRFFCHSCQVSYLLRSDSHPPVQMQRVHFDTSAETQLQMLRLRSPSGLYDLNIKIIRNAPNGRLRLNSKAGMQTGTVGEVPEAWSGCHQYASETGFHLHYQSQKNIPRKNAITVAAKPVFSEIHKGLQFISARNSLILI